MARPIKSRLKISGVLISQSPIHIGGNHEDALVDLSLAVNGEGKFYIPGTSLAGALRGWMSAAFQAETTAVDALWGKPLGQKAKVESQDEQASYLFVEDAIVEGEVNVEIRDGVGIDRLSGTAAEHIKFDRAILPKGTKIPIELTLEEQQVDRSDTQLVAALVTALEQGKVQVGAAKTRGLGRVQLQDVVVKRQDFSTHSGIVKFLTTGGAPANLIAELPARMPSHVQRVAIAIHWRPLGAFMVKAEQEGIAVDMLPLVSQVPSENPAEAVSFVLPGSSIKGALRTQAERIVRTVRQLSQGVDSQVSSQEDSEQSSQEKKRQQFLKQVEVPLVSHLFGKAAQMEHHSNNGSTAQSRRSQAGRMGALGIEDCYAKLKLSRQQWAEIEAATDEVALREKLAAAHLETTQQAMHVAIDRWTGGAAEGFLYSTLEPFGVAWSPMQLTLDLQRLSGLQEAGIALLLLVLRDLANGRIALGYGANRGMGAIEVTAIEMTSTTLESPFDQLAHLQFQNGRLTGNDELLQHLNTAWQNWQNWLRSEDGQTR